MSNVSAQAFQLGVNQTITTGVTSVLLTNPFAAGTTVVRLCATAACHVKVGNPSATATTADVYIPPNFPMLISVVPGQKIAAIQNAAAGVLHVTELSE